MTAIINTVEHIGGGVWVATLDQDAMEDIAWYLPAGGRHSTGAKRVFALADKDPEMAPLSGSFPAPEGGAS